MILYLLDTDHISLLEFGNPQIEKHINHHHITTIALAVISLQEQMEGFLGAVHRARNRQQIAHAYDRLVLRLLPVWTRFQVLSFPEAAILRFEHLRSLRLNVGPMDLRIAAIALENGLTVV